MAGFKPAMLRFTSDDHTVARSFTLAGSILAALAGGTNYVFSAYAPQLGARLHIDHTQLNMIALAGNVGVYSSGPLWGSITDARGPKLLYFLAMTLLFIGYSGIKLFYDGVFNLPAETKHTSTSFPFIVLIVFAYMSGAGGNAGLTGSINAVARSFSDAKRSTAVGLVASGFGLSAFFFSTLAHTAFSDDTSAFLSVLALGTTIPNVLAFFIVRVVPHDEAPNISKEGAGYSVLHQTEDHDDDEDVVYDLPRDGIQRRLSELDEERHNSTELARGEPPSALSNSQPNLHQSHHSIDRRRSKTRPRDSRERYRSRSPASSFDLPSEFGNSAASTAEFPHLAPHDLEDISENPGPRSASTPSNTESIRGAETSPYDADPETIVELIKRGDFWLMFFTVSLMSGTGLMWINNVGSIAQALVAQGQPDTWDQARAAKVQAAQVSIVSVMNCLGRIFIGVITDHAKHSLGIRRTFWLLPISLLFILSQTIAAHTTSPNSLWISSTILGSAYGAMFSLAPMIILEWFGITRFSRNWGTVALSPVLGGNLFSLAFGRNLDKHASNPTSVIGATRDITRHLATRASTRGGLPDTTDHMCFDGLACYESSLKMTIVACFLASMLSAWATYRDRNIYAVRERARASHLRPESGSSSGESDDNDPEVVPRASRNVPTPQEEERLLGSS